MATRTTEQPTSIAHESGADAPGPAESEGPPLAPSGVRVTREARATAAVPDASFGAPPRSLPSRLGALLQRLLPQSSPALKRRGAGARAYRARPRAVGVVLADWEYVTRIAGRDALLRWAMGGPEEVNRRG